jgi:outer membrane lipoprotein-sorting protein
MKKILLLILLAVVALPSIAQQRSEAEAAAIANAFMQNNGYEFNITKTPKSTKYVQRKPAKSLLSTSSTTHKKVAL